jgi:hypothetical protein
MQARHASSPRQLDRNFGAPLRVVCHAYTNVADGIHVSFLEPADADAPGD